MPNLIDANVTTRTNTTATDPHRIDYWQNVAHEVEDAKRKLVAQIAPNTLTRTFVHPSAARSESGAPCEVTGFSHDRHGKNEFLAATWKLLASMARPPGEPPDRLTRATTPTATTVSSVARLLRRHHRDERLRRMSPEARAAYRRIRDLRNEIGPVEFDIVKALRELRDDA